MRSNNNNNNHRCAVCDYIAFDHTPGDPYTRGFHYHRHTDEYICSVCQSEIFDTLGEFPAEQPLEALREPVQADLDDLGTSLAIYEEASVRAPEAVVEHVNKELEHA